MNWRRFLILCIGLALEAPVQGQTPRSGQIADSSFIRPFAIKNDLRVNYLSQRYVLEFGSTRESSTSSSALFSNVSDLLGFGLTYKFIDFDLGFSLPKTTLLETGLQNLWQFRLSGSYTARRWSIRGYWLESTGLVASDASGQFNSSPTIYVLNLGLQYTYYFNHTKYSFKAAAYQSETQRRSAASFLVRVEPVFRRLGVGGVLVPAAQDTPVTYGEQAGLRYVYAPGLMVQPGYGYNWTNHDGKWFVSPMVFAGGGLALNVYKGDTGERSEVNVEWKGAAILNAGYNGPRAYVAVRTSFEMDYFLLGPSYFLTSDLKLGITAGYRFNAVEKWIPDSIF